WSYFHPNGHLIRTVNGGDFMNRGRYEVAHDSSGVRTLVNGNGLLVEYHQNGQPSSLIHVSDFHKDTVTTYYRSGGRRDRMIYMTDSTRNVWWNEGTLLDAWDSTGLRTLTDGYGYRWTALDDGESRSRISYAAGLMHGDSEQCDHRQRLRQLDCYDHGDWTGRVIYFNNGKRYTDFDCFNAPWFWMDEEIQWWYNGRVRRYDNGDSIVEYYPSGQLRCIGFYPSRDSTVKTDPNREYVLKGYTVSGATHWDESGTDEEGSVGSFASGWTSSSTAEPVDWLRSYYADGALRAKVEWMDSCACLLRTEYLPTGVKHRSGCVRYGELKFSPTERDGDTYFIGYHRIGMWKEFNDKGDILLAIDFDELPWEDRRIQNYSSPVE
ncbi:MAG: hypothetical protein WEC15_04370, partial [Flavobacteriales bacterium]